MLERYEEGSARSARNILSIIDKMKEKDEVVLVFIHKSVDGDCVGSSAGIVSILRNFGVEAYIAFPEELPENMEFLGIEDIIFHPDSNSDIAAEYKKSGTINGKKIGAVIATDCSAGSRMGICGEIFDAVDLKVVVDHHASVTTRNENFWIDPDASSASEMVYYVAEQVAAITGRKMGEVLDPRAAKAVLAGIVTDTGRFSYNNTRSETLTTAGLLIELGGAIAQVCYNLIDRKSKPQFLLSAWARSRVQFLCDGKFALTVVPYEQFVEYGAGPDGVDDVVSALRDIDGVELAIVLRELENGDIRGNIRSQDYFDCSKLAESLGGGGHVRAAGFTVNGRDINEFADELIKIVREAL